MVNFIGPSAVMLNSHSADGFHKAIIPTRQWFDETSSGGEGTFDSWGSGHIDADTMVKALVTALKGAYPTSYTFDNYIIFNFPGVGDPGVPVASNSLAVAGTNSTAVWSRATQATWSWRTDAFGIFKLVLLDYESGGTFNKNATVPGSGPLHDADAEVTNPANAWSGRDNGQPSTFISSTATLNEKLRRAYRLT
jgi:hypothetical protein